MRDLLAAHPYETNDDIERLCNRLIASELVSAYCDLETVDALHTAAPEFSAAHDLLCDAAYRCSEGVADQIRATVETIRSITGEPEACYAILESLGDDDEEDYEEDEDGGDE